LQSAASESEIFAELLKQNELCGAQMREYSTLRAYAVMNSEEGSHLIDRMVLNPSIETETPAAAGKEHHDSSITAANYTFPVPGQEGMGAYHCYVVEALPKAVAAAFLDRNGGSSDSAERVS
jgi:hypothetical protein